MKIALIGYGKMGKTIERLALVKGHEIVLIIDKDNPQDFTAENLSKADVAIEFSQPESAFTNAKTCLEAGVPVIVGTTGWLDKLLEIKAICEQSGSAMIQATNYSIGVNLFFALNRYLAKMMNAQPQYDIQIEEIHHTQKLDAPSGTAISLANGILSEVARKTKWVNYDTDVLNELSIISKRIDPAPGTHEVTYHSEIDTIKISHEAHSREGFALGALTAAEWIVGKKGFFTMQDVLGF
ncbi:MAG: 4-hydroxy-tetrahydrodipicolinate reductase [Saprospiraceae bacterium]